MLARVRATGRLVYGCDAEGGGPYAFPDPEQPSEVTGFEVELMDRWPPGLGSRPVFHQGQWDALLPTLDAGHVDLVVNGYELTPSRAERLPGDPPLLRLPAPGDGPAGGAGPLVRRPDAAPARRRALEGRASWAGPSAEDYALEHGGANVEVISFNGATDAMMAVTNGQADATLQDLPAARFYRDQYPKLELVGPPVGRGYYVMYLRNGDEALRDALDRGLERLIRTGELRRIYERYGIWTDAQEELGRLDLAEVMRAMRGETLHGWPLMRRYAPTLLTSAGLTIFLSVTSMPLAMAIGLLVALGRLYGPGPLRLGAGRATSSCSAARR